MDNKRPVLIDLGISAALFTACVLSRLPFTSKLLYNMDSVQFALGMSEFDVTLHQPHPPGYFLYVLMGRAMSLVFSDPNTSLVAISVLFSGLCAVMLYVLAKELFGRAAGVSAAVIGITSPLMWFHGEVALTYMPEAFMSLLVAWLCLKTIRGGFYYGLAASVVIAIAGGVRQNTMVFLMPLWLYSLSGLGIKKIIYCAAAFAAAVSAWFIPMTVATGGYSAYRSALDSLWTVTVWSGVSTARVFRNAQYMTYYICTGLLLAVPLLLADIYYIATRRIRAGDGKRSRFFLLWLTPAMAFHLLIFFQPAAPGYTLIYFVGFIILVSGSLASKTAAGSAVKISRGAATAIVSLMAAVNILFFFTWPATPSARTIAMLNKMLPASFEAVRKNFSPEDTEIIGGSQFLFSYRHAMYYLPEYKVHDVAEELEAGKTFFCGQYRKTCRESFITPLPTTRNFVDFFIYGPDEIEKLPKSARIIPVGDGRYFASYQDLEQLRKVERIAGSLDPSIINK